MSDADTSTYEVGTRPMSIVGHDQCHHKGLLEKNIVSDEEVDDSDDESDPSVELDKYGKKMDSRGDKHDEKKQDCLIKRSVDLTTQLYDVGWYVKAPDVDPVKQMIQRMREVHQ